MGCKSIFVLIGIVALEISLINGEASLLRNLTNAKTLQEFLQNVKINGRPIHLSDIYLNTSTAGDNDEHLYVSGGLSLARPDECSPRPVTVEIPRRPGDHNVIYWPKCTAIERCGGCCVSNMLKCSPTSVENVEFHVLKTRIPYPGAPHLEWEGPMPVVLERHLACVPVCRMTAADCTGDQTFNDADCVCRCTHVHPCTPLQTWDEDKCACRCRVIRDCSPSTFNPLTCLCELNTGGGISYTSDNDEISADQAALLQHHSQNEVPSTAQPTQPPADPCLTQFCPPNFGKRIDPTNPNVCLCTPPFFFPGHK